MLWFRMYAEFAADPKMQSMDETLQRRYIMLLCLKCNGDLEKLNEDELLCALRIDRECLQKTKNVFVQKGLIDENWSILNWDKRQFKSDSSAARVRRYRDKETEQKSRPLQKRYSNGDVTPPDTDTDTDTDTDKRLKRYTSDSDEIRLSEHLFNHILKNNPKAKAPNIQSWAQSIDKMIRTDNRSVQDIKAVIEWCQQDSFWKCNILSTKKLRDKFDQLAVTMRNTKTKSGNYLQDANLQACKEFIEDDRIR
jgi:hypothetical protein